HCMRKLHTSPATSHTLSLHDALPILIDAKAPNEAYREAATATDETVRAAKLMEHATKVRTHIDALGAKNYWEQFQPSPEFEVLRSEEHTSELQSRENLVCRLLLEKKK